MTQLLNLGDCVILQQQDLQSLFTALQQFGYELVGLTIREGAIVYDTLRSVEDLPTGWTDEQAGGAYRLKRRNDQALLCCRSAFLEEILVSATNSTVASREPTLMAGARLDLETMLGTSQAQSQDIDIAKHSSLSHFA